MNEFSHPDPKELERIDRLTEDNVHNILFNYGGTAQRIAFELLSDLMDIYQVLTGFDSFLRQPNLDWSRKMSQDLENIPSLKKLFEDFESPTDLSEK